MLNNKWAWKHDLLSCAVFVKFYYWIIFNKSDLCGHTGTFAEPHACIHTSTQHILTYVCDRRFIQRLSRLNWFLIRAGMHIVLTVACTIARTSIPVDLCKKKLLSSAQLRQCDSSGSRCLYCIIRSPAQCWPRADRLPRKTVTPAPHAHDA